MVLAYLFLSNKFCVRYRLLMLRWREIFVKISATSWLTSDMWSSTTITVGLEVTWQLSAHHSESEYPRTNNYSQVHFEDGLPHLNDEEFDGREPTMIVTDDHISDVKQLVADIFYKNFSSSRHQHTISHTKLVWQKQVCKNHTSECALFGVVQKSSRCWTISMICETDASNMLEVCRRGVWGRYEYAVRLSTSGSKKTDQDERYRLRTNVFTGEMQHVYVHK